MNEQIQTWAAIAGILGLLVGILSLLRDFFNLQWETSRSLIKRLLVDRRLWASIAILLVLTSLWSLYSQNSTLLQVIQQGEAEIAEIYKTQTAQPKYELTIEAILSAPTIIPRIIEATTVVKETSVVRETVIVEATPIVVATTAPATIQNTSPTPTTALPVPTSITGTLEVLTFRLFWTWTG